MSNFKVGKIVDLVTENWLRSISGLFIINSLLSTIWLLLIERDPKNAAFFGLSASRFIIIVFFSLFIVGFGFALFVSLTNKKRDERVNGFLSKLLVRRNVAGLISVGALISTLALLIAILFFISQDQSLHPLFFRTLPLFFWLISTSYGLLFIISEIAKAFPSVDLKNRVFTFLHTPITRSKRVGAIFLGSFSVILVAYFIYTQFVYPLPFYFEADPEVSFFMTSLGIFKGYPYGFQWHPNTPLNILGSLFFLLTFPIAKLSDFSFIDFNLRNPQYFLIIARSFILLASINVYWQIKKHMIKVDTWKDLFALLLICLGYFAFHNQALSSLRSWNNNIFVLPFGALYWIVVHKIFKDKNPIRTYDLILIGVFAGLLIAANVPNVGWLIGTFVSISLIKSWRGISRFSEIIKANFITGVAAILAFLSTFLFGGRNYLVFFDFIFTIIAGRGPYGYGDEGAISVDQMGKSLLRFLDGNIYLVIVIAGLLLLSISLLIARRRTFKHNSNEWALLAGIGVQILITVSQYSRQYKEIYTLSLSAVIPILLALLYTLAKSINTKYLVNTPASYFRKTTHEITWISLILFFMIGTFRSTTADLQHFFSQHKKVEEKTAIYNEFMSQFRSDHPDEIDDLIILIEQNVNVDWCPALWEGNNYSLDPLSNEILAICPNIFPIHFFLKAQDLKDVPFYKLEPIGEKASKEADLLVINDTDRYPKLLLEYEDKIIFRDQIVVFYLGELP